MPTSRSPRWRCRAATQPCLGFTIRNVGRRLNADARAGRELPRSVEQLTELVGRVPLKELVREATDLIERLCIEAALELTQDNRASAAEMLGLSRQSLYVKLRRYGLGDLADSRRVVRSGPDADGRREPSVGSGSAASAAGTPRLTRRGSAKRHAQCLPHAPQLSAVAELLKPITWFPPMWAFGCGVVASGVAVAEHWPWSVVGIVLAGPLVCATSQAANDWFDRHVDAINEPQRPIPSGRMPGRWGLYIAIAWTLLSLLVALALGPWGVRRRGRRARARVGLQRAAATAEAQRLVGQRRVRPSATKDWRGSPARP